jgi:HD-like signal output (HDOD) protein
MLRLTRYDVVVTDLIMPIMHGHALCGEILSMAERPRLVVLTGVTEPRLAVDLKARGVDQIHFKPCDFEIFAREVAALVKTSSSNDGPSRAQKVAQKCAHIGCVPRLSGKLVGYLTTKPEDVPLDDLCRDVSLDPGATSELLRLTTYSRVATRRRITSVDEAVKLLGAKRSISLICSLECVRAQRNLLRTPGLESLRDWYHRRAVLTAAIASTFSLRLEVVSPETAFILGLLQDIGTLMMGVEFPKRYPLLIQRFRQIGWLELPLAEKDAFGITHAEVSAGALLNWGFPPSLADLVLVHHASDEVPNQPDGHKAFLRVMSIGEAVADLCDSSHAARHSTLRNLLQQYVASPRKQCEDCFEEAFVSAINWSELLCVSSPDQKSLDDIVQQVTGNEPPHPARLRGTLKAGGR